MTQLALGVGNNPLHLTARLSWQNEELEKVHSKHLPLFASPLLLKPDYKRWSWDFLTRACWIFFILVYLSISVDVDGVCMMPRPCRQGKTEVVSPVYQRKKGQSRGRGRAKGITTGLNTFLWIQLYLQWLGNLVAIWLWVSNAHKHTHSILLRAHQGVLDCYSSQDSQGLAYTGTISIIFHFKSFYLEKSIHSHSH